jgi:hypothetical protein
MAKAQIAEGRMAVRMDWFAAGGYGKVARLKIKKGAGASPLFLN